MRKANFTLFDDEMPLLDPLLNAEPNPAHMTAEEFEAKLDEVSPEAHERDRRTVRLFVDHDTYERMLATDGCSLLNRDKEQAEIFTVRGMRFIVTGWCSPAWKNGRPDRTYACAHRVVPVDEFDGPTTYPSEWNVRGVCKFLGIRVLGLDGKWYVTADEHDWQMHDRDYWDHEDWSSESWQCRYDRKTRQVVKLFNWDTDPDAVEAYMARHTTA